MDLTKDLLTPLPEGASREEYLPAYGRPCEKCFDAMYEPTMVESLEDIQNLLKRCDSAKRSKKVKSGE